MWITSTWITLPASGCSDPSWIADMIILRYPLLGLRPRFAIKCLPCLEYVAVRLVYVSYRMFGIHSSWDDLSTNPKSYGLQASVDFMFIVFISGLFFPEWRKWLWGAAAIPILAIIFQLLGGPSP